MNEKIKEILDRFNKGHDELTVEEYILLENYIMNLQQENEKLKYNARGQVNDYFKDKYADEVLKNAELQQDLDKANDIIKKDRQFYKCRMDEYVDLKKENEELKQTLHNITINGVKEENTTVLDLIKENKRLKEIIKDNTILVKDENGNYQECNINPLDYKSRCEKLGTFITTLISELNHCELNGTKKLDIVSDYIKQEYENILKGSDENE